MCTTWRAQRRVRGRYLCRWNRRHFLMNRCVWEEDERPGEAPSEEELLINQLHLTWTTTTTFVCLKDSQTEWAWPQWCHSMLLWSQRWVELRSDAWLGWKPFGLNFNQDWKWLHISAEKSVFVGAWWSLEVLQLTVSRRFYFLWVHFHSKLKLLWNQNLIFSFKWQLVHISRNGPNKFHRLEHLKPLKCSIINCSRSGGCSESDGKTGSNPTNTGLANK